MIYAGNKLHLELLFNFDYIYFFNYLYIVIWNLKKININYNILNITRHGTIKRKKNIKLITMKYISRYIV